MMLSRDIFLDSVLGTAGVDALTPLIKASPEIAAYILPRAVVAFINTILPGIATELPNCPVFLTKSNLGYSGVAELNGSEYAFSDADASHVAAVVSIALDAKPGRPNLKDVDLARLGKTIDALVKAQRRRHGEASVGTGTNAAPIPPEAPEPPVPTQTAEQKKTKRPRLPRPTKPGKKTETSTLRLSVSESLVPCQICGKKQMLGTSFVGCICFQALAKSVKVKVMDWGAGFELTLGPEWGPEGALTLRESMRKR